MSSNGLHELLHRAILSLETFGYGQPCTIPACDPLLSRNVETISLQVPSGQTRK
jgi:hypothetical protein